RTKGMIPRAMGTGRNARAFRTAARRGRSQGGGGCRRSKSAARRHLEREGVDLELGCKVATGQLEPVVLRGIRQLFARARALILYMCAVLQVVHHFMHQNGQVRRCLTGPGVRQKDRPGAIVIHGNSFAAMWATSVVGK